MTDVFVKSTGEQLLGGNLGVLTFDMVSNYVAGKVIPSTSTSPQTMRAVVNTVVKALGGAGVMMAGSKVHSQSDDAGNMLIGFGGGPIMTIANDWWTAMKGTDPGTTAFLKARGGSVVMATPTAAVVRTTTTPTSVVRTGATSTSALRVGVY